MSKRKNFYYVLVITNEGPKFVTGIPERNTAEYNKLEKPMLFTSRDFADNVSLGLTLNFNLAYTIVSTYEIEHQPYLYGEGDFKWKPKTKKTKKTKKEEK